MYRLLLTVLAVVLLGCGTAEAQMTSPNPSRTLPVRRPSPSPTLMTAPSLMPVPGTLTAGSVTPGGLGTVQLYLGILAPFPGTSLGGIATCPAAGIMGPTSTGAASGATVSGGLVSSPSVSAGASNFSISSPPIVPPIPITDPFGTITASTFCNPTATMTDPASLASTVDPTLTSTTDSTLTSALVGSPVPPSLASNSTLTSAFVGSPVPLLTPSSTAAAPDFSDATVPSGATAPGMSPLITVAPPILSLTTCAGTSMGTPSLAPLGNILGATTIVGSSPSGC